MINTLDRHVIGQFLRAQGVEAWGVAGNDPSLPRAPDLPRALPILMSVRPAVVRSIRNGPTQEYCDEYDRLNTALNAATEALADLLRGRGCRAVALPATAEDASRAVADPGAFFSHKSAATRAGLGWIGKTALFVSSQFGPAVRLATVFTDLELPPGDPVTEGLCGACRACVAACPAGCGRDVDWRAGMSRDDLFDAAACDRYMNANHTAFTRHICGICIAACPLARKD